MSTFDITVLIVWKFPFERLILLHLKGRTSIKIVFLPNVIKRIFLMKKDYFLDCNNRILNRIRKSKDISF